MKLISRIEALESMVGNLAERILELEEENRTLNEIIKNKLHEEDDNIIIVKVVKK